MSKKLLTIKVRGKEREWSFTFNGDPKYIDAWRADGLQVSELVNTIPLWVANLGPRAIQLWCIAQDVFNFKNPFRGGEE